MEKYKLYNITRIILMIAVVLMLINYFIFQFSDVIVRIIGAVMIGDLPLFVYSARKKNKIEDDI